MANRLKMALADDIKKLHKQGWSQRRIARELNVNRDTVAAPAQAGGQAAEEAKPANAPIGSGVAGDNSKTANAPIGSGEAGGNSKPANAPIGCGPAAGESAEAQPAALLGLADESVQPNQPESVRGVGRPSDCEPHRTAIVAMLEMGLSAQRIYQDLVSDHGFSGSYYSVRRFVKKLDRIRPLPFRRLECGPGEEAQVDFGSGAPIVTAEGKKRRCHCFRIVLSHSRKGYSEVVDSQTTENFIRCLENAFWHFGGSPKRLVIDNLRAAVCRAG